MNTRCILTPALEGERGRIYVDGKEVEVPDNTELTLRLNVRQLPDENGRGSGVIVAYHLPRCTELSVLCSRARWELMQYLGEDEQPYKAGSLHRLVEARTDLHNTKVWFVHWTPVSFDIKPHPYETAPA